MPSILNCIGEPAWCHLVLWHNTKIAQVAATEGGRGRGIKLQSPSNFAWALEGVFLANSIQWHGAQTVMELGCRCRCLFLSHPHSMQHVHLSVRLGDSSPYEFFKCLTGPRLLRISALDTRYIPEMCHKMWHSALLCVGQSAKKWKVHILVSMALIGSHYDSDLTLYSLN